MKRRGTGVKRENGSNGRVVAVLVISMALFDLFVLEAA